MCRIWALAMPTPSPPSSNPWGTSCSCSMTLPGDATRLAACMATCWSPGACRLSWMVLGTSAASYMGISFFPWAASCKCWHEGSCLQSRCGQLVAGQWRHQINRGACLAPAWNNDMATRGSHCIRQLVQAQNMICKLAVGQESGGRQSHCKHPMQGRQQAHW